MKKFDNLKNALPIYLDKPSLGVVITQANVRLMIEAKKDVCMLGKVGEWLYVAESVYIFNDKIYYDKAISEKPAKYVPYDKMIMAYARFFLYIKDIKMKRVNELSEHVPYIILTKKNKLYEQTYSYLNDALYFEISFELYNLSNFK